MIAATTALFAPFFTIPSTAQALPGPTCPGNGNESVAIGADGGWCNYLYLPDGSHVSCRWADFMFLIGDIGGHTECRRVDAHNNLLPGSPPWMLFPDWGANEGSGGRGNTPPMAVPPVPPPPINPLPPGAP